MNRQTIIDAVHSTIYPYFCKDEGVFSDNEKLLLSVNKAICTAIKALPLEDEVEVVMTDLELLKQCKQEVLNCYTKLRETGALQNKAVRYSLVEYSLLQAVNKLSVAIEDIEEDD